jgi:hypothetical protein
MTQDKACIQVYGANQCGVLLRIVSDRDCRIWMSQIIEIAGCHSLNRVTGEDTGMNFHAIANYTLDLEAGIPADLRLGIPIIPDGLYRNVATLAPHRALLLSSGDSWPGYELEWLMKYQPFQ